MDKTAVKEFFDLHAPCWDDNMVTDDAKMNIILNAAQIENGKSVLDIACGTGVMFDYYLARGVTQITGLDLSPNMAAIAAEKYRKDARVTVLCGDAETYSFKGEYDCCMVFNAFPHFCHPAQLIQNLKKALKAGGTLTVAHDRGRKALDLHHEGEASSISCGLMSERELEAIFLACGFGNTVTYATDEIYIVSGVK